MDRSGDDSKFRKNNRGNGELREVAATRKCQSATHEPLRASSRAGILDLLEVSGVAQNPARELARRGQKSALQTAATCHAVTARAGREAARLLHELR